MSKELALLTSFTPDTTIASYLKKVQSFPMLSAQEEYDLAKRWQEQADIKAAHKLVTSHLKLVAKVAFKFKGYGLPMLDLISEGNIGLMHAVKKFKPEMGFRLSTYALWWIKATIQEYVLRSWSMVKLGTSAAQKKLFFNLKKLQNKISHNSKIKNSEEAHEYIANELGVGVKEVQEMEQRLSNQEVSLNTTMYQDNNSEILEFIPTSDPDQETVAIAKQNKKQRQELLREALSKLNEREYDIIAERKLKDKATTLDELSVKYKVSRERIRQIEEKALEKLKKTMVPDLTRALPSA